MKNQKYVDAVKEKIRGMWLDLQGVSLTKVQRDELVPMLDAFNDNVRMAAMLGEFDENTDDSKDN